MNQVRRVSGYPLGRESDSGTGAGGVCCNPLSMRGIAPVHAGTGSIKPGVGQGTLSFFSRIRKITLFCSVGALSTAVDIGLLYVLTVWLGIWYLSSATISYGCGILVSFILNKWFTFHDRTTASVIQFPTFAAVSAGCFGLTMLIVWLLVELVHTGYLEAKGVAVAGSFLFSYFGQSRVTFSGGNLGD